MCTKIISKISLFICISYLGLSSVYAQYTQLIPSMKPGPTGSLNTIPDYGKLLTQFQEGLLAYAEITCQSKLNSDLKTLIEKARNQVEDKTTYLVIADYTEKMNCKITTFQPLYGKPSAISNPETKLLVYTIDIYPWIIIGNNRY